jgi:hypothetical protein
VSGGAAPRGGRGACFVAALQLPRLDDPDTWFRMARGADAAPEGSEVAPTDLSLLDPVRTRGPIYRPS